MEYLLVMSFSGSTMMGIYFLLKHLLKDKASSRLFYLIIKEAILFFFDAAAIFEGLVSKDNLGCFTERTEEGGTYTDYMDAVCSARGRKDVC